MPKMIDGINSANRGTSVSSLGAVYSPQYLNQVFANQNLGDTRLQLSHELVTQNFEDISCCAALLHRERLATAGWQIDHRHLSQDNFYASASLSVPENNIFTIEFSAAIPVILYSIAAELDAHMPGNTDTARIKGCFNNGLSSADIWFPWLTSERDISATAKQTALDAALLIYFHEVAHIIFGHCAYTPQNAVEERALEFDADFNAGTMFSLWLKMMQSPMRISASADETVDRLIRAGFLVGTAFKVFSGPSENYHYPTTRLKCFYAGAIYGVMASGSGLQFKTDQEGNEFWEKRILKIQNLMFSALRKSSLAYFAGTEADIQTDTHDFWTVSGPVREQLKDGPLKQFVIPVRP